VEFEWDAGKAAANRRKHGVSFEEAATVFDDPHAISIADAAHSGREDRQRTIGLSVRLRVLIVVHTERIGVIVRVISARKANKREASEYEEEVRQRRSRDNG
jgi:uncharacterized DUF497 family protein